MTVESPPPRNPKRIDRNDPAVRTMAVYLRKTAEFEAGQEMKRLMEEARELATMEQRSLSLPHALWEKIDQHGLEWLRAVIKRAKPPKR